MEGVEKNECSICGLTNDSNHKNSITHKFNFVLFEWSKYRKKIVQDSHNVAVSIKLIDFVNGTRLKFKDDKKDGNFITKATVAQATIQNLNGITVLFTVHNTHPAQRVILLKCYLLHPDTSFQIVQIEGAENINEAKALAPGATYSFKVRYQVNQVSVGSFRMPVMMKFQTRNCEEFSIGREMVVFISDEEESTDTIVKKSPFTSVIWEKKVHTWIAAVNQIPYLEYYPIPKKQYNVYKSGLTEYNTMPNKDHIILDKIREKIAPNYPTKHNYSDFFHTVLWLDEIGAELMLKRYNMEKVNLVRLPGDFLELEVPGLAEKRPSLIRGDHVMIRLHRDHTAYEGIIVAVKDKTIWISGVNSEFVEQIEDNPNYEVDVAFQLGRLNYERMHASIDKCVSNGMVNSLFPDGSFSLVDSIKPYQISNDGFINMDITNNKEQREAVLNILNCKSGRAPYIIFGPPGTGKTITLVEAILQIKKLTRKRILVCAPANAACDWIAEKLIKSNKCTKQELLRVHSLSRDWNTVPEIVKPYSNHHKGEYILTQDVDLLKYRIVISTLINIGRYSFKHVYQPDFVFIDEAAQAMEPEATIPIGLLSTGKQLILAGDPQQLGPTCSSAVAEKLQLGVSILERLMKIPIYQNKEPSFITMLKLNFRAHPEVLKLPNELFYGNQLQAVSTYARTDPIAKIFVYCKIYNRQHEYLGQPVEFCSVIAKERREGNSPSYFNEAEIEMVFKYVKTLLNLSETRVTQNDIGIVTPYVRQVYRIKEKLKHYGYSGVEVGTAESFQGREKRIVLVSTVRAQNSLLLYDKQYRLGFVKNKKRFNVALTRAISKLIVIGCPNVLRYDTKCWLKYIEFCEQRQSYFGGNMERRSIQLKHDVIDRISNVESIKPFSNL